MAIAERHGIPILEDCAQANGGEFQGRKLGTFGRIGMFSLQLNKNATAGEGGLLVTDDAALYERCVSAHDLGIPWVGSAPCETGPQSVTWGLGRRMSELCGAVAAVQIAKAAADRRPHAGLEAADQGDAARHARPPVPPPERRARRQRAVPDSPARQTNRRRCRRLSE